jgi:hypothetical protein
VRIAALERELAIMEAEFLRELDKLSGAESDTAAFWQGKCAALEREVGCLRRRRDGDYGGDGDGVGVVDGDGDDGEEEERGEGEDGDQDWDELRFAWRRAREMAEHKDGEIARLQAQVRGLKEWVSVSTRADGQAQTSDEVFGEGMARLGNGLQNWVLVNFRRARVGKSHLLPFVAGTERLRSKTDLSGAHEDAISELARLVPMYEELASASRIHLLQSVVSRLLVDLVFDAYFVGLPGDVATQMGKVEAFLSSSKASR